MSALIVVLALSAGAASEASSAKDRAAFPIPAEKGMRLDAKATEFRVPFGFARVERFYRDFFVDRKDVTFVKSDSEDGQPTLTLRSNRKGDRWTKAVVVTDGTTCRITVTRVIVLADQRVEGELPPVQFILARSSHVKEELESIDHAER